MGMLGTGAFIWGCTSAPPPTATPPSASALRPRQDAFNADVAGYWVAEYGPHGRELVRIRSSEGEFVATKVTGDANVPAGQDSFTSDMFGNARVLVADTGFRNPRRVQGFVRQLDSEHLLVTSEVFGELRFRRVTETEAAAFQRALLDRAKLSVEDVALSARQSTVVVKTSESLGTGFVVAGGLVVTNLHVVAGADDVMVQYPNGSRYQVQNVRAIDTFHDLVLLDTSLTHRPLPLASGPAPRQGAPVVVVGNPLGLEGSVSAGVVSAVRQEASNSELIQVDAAISPGSSGAPVLDRSGRVVGVVEFLVKNGQNLNFAIPIRFVKALLAASEGPIPMSTFAAITATEPKAETPSSTRQVEFPQTIAGLRLGDSPREVNIACKGTLKGTTELAVCETPPVVLPFALPKVWTTFTANELTQVSLLGNSWTEVRAALTSKYGPPTVQKAATKGKWVVVDEWKDGPGMAFWVLKGGSIIAISPKGKNDLVVRYQSERKAAIERENF